MPLTQVRTQLYPCLREKGEPGEIAIASLDAKISGRKNELYDWGNRRFPDKFPDGGSADDAAMADMVSLYCADPQFQKKLQRSPDDFNHELMSWLEEQASDAICDCILELHNPISQLLDHSQDIAEDLYDRGARAGASASEKGAGTKNGGQPKEEQKSRARAVEQQGVLAIDKIAEPFYNLTEDRMADFGKSILQGITDMALYLSYCLRLFWCFLSMFAEKF